MRKHTLTLLGGALLLFGAAGASAENLLDIYHQAQQSDPQLQAAEAAFRAAREATPQARASLLPSIDLSGSRSRTESDTKASSFSTTGKRNYNSTSYDLTLTQPLFHKDYFVQLKQADGKIAQSQAQLTAAEQDLMVRAATAYFNVLSAEDNLTFAQANKKAIGQQLEQTQQRFKVGLSAITDVHEAQASYDLSVSQEIQARNQVDTSREALREITGKAPGMLAKLASIQLVEPTPADIQQWVKTALDQNLSLLAQEAATRVAKEEIDRQRAGHYPTLDLVADHGYSDTIGASTGSKRTDNTLTLQFSLPLYSGGGTSSKVREAVALADQSQQQLEQTRRTAEKDTRDAYLSVISGISSVQASQQAVTSSETALKATEAGYEVGTRTIVDVLNSQQQLYKAQSELADARYKYILSTLSLKQAAGTLAGTDLEKINGWLGAAK